MEKKLCELHELQDMRDKAPQAWSEHKKSHWNPSSARRRTQLLGSTK